jgi:hypothetical protein
MEKAEILWIRGVDMEIMKTIVLNIFRLCESEKLNDLFFHGEQYIKDFAPGGKK